MREVEKLIESFGCKLYDTEIEKVKDSRTIYRVLVHKIGGISLDELAEISRALSPLLDVKPPLKDAYFLEVSSPGLERKLKNKDHLVYSIGDNIRFQVESKRTKGKLLSVDGDAITVETKNGAETFEIASLVNAKTVFEWKES